MDTFDWPNLGHVLILVARGWYQCSLFHTQRLTIEEFLKHGEELNYWIDQGGGSRTKVVTTALYEVKYMIKKKEIIIFGK